MSTARRTLTAAKGESAKRQSSGSAAENDTLYTAPRQRVSVRPVQTLSRTTASTSAVPATAGPGIYSNYRVDKSDAAAAPAPSAGDAVAFPTFAKATDGPNAIYQLHHQALHRYLELGWRVHWSYQDNVPTPAATSTAVASAAAVTAEGSGGLGDSTQNDRRLSMTPRHSAAAGRRTTSTGCLASLNQCPFCAEETLLKKGAPATTGRANSNRGRSLTARGGGVSTARTPPPVVISSQPLSARLVSLQRWVEAYMHSKEKEALRACLPYITPEALEYMATVGVRTGWMALKLYAELPTPLEAQSCTPSPVGFFALSPFSELQAVAAPDVKDLLALPRFCPGDEHKEVHYSLEAPGTRFFWLQKRLELSNRRILAAASSALLLGDVSACDIFLVLAPQQASSRPDNKTLTLTVWGRAHRRRSGRRASTASASSEGKASSSSASTASVITTAATPASDELFFLAHRLEDYWRLAAAFGWVYGWQLAYSTRGAPLASQIWLRFFNASALEAAQQLHR